MIDCRAERDAEYQALSKSLGMKTFPEAQFYMKQVDRHSDRFIYAAAVENRGGAQTIQPFRNFLADNFDPVVDNYDYLTDNFDTLAKKCLPPRGIF